MTSINESFVHYSLKYLKPTEKGGLRLSKEKAINHPLIFGRSSLYDKKNLIVDYVSQPKASDSETVANELLLINKLAYPSGSFKHETKKSVIDPKTGEIKTDSKGEKVTEKDYREFSASELKQGEELAIEYLNGEAVNLQELSAKFPQVLLPFSGDYVATTPVMAIDTAYIVSDLIYKEGAKARGNSYRYYETQKARKELQALEETLLTTKVSTKAEQLKAEKSKAKIEELQKRIQDLAAEGPAVLTSKPRIKQFIHRTGGANAQNAGKFLKNSTHQRILGNAPSKSIDLYSARTTLYKTERFLCLNPEFVSKFSKSVAHFQNKKLDSHQERQFYLDMAYQIKEALIEKIDTLESCYKAAKVDSSEELSAKLDGLSVAKKGMLFSEYRTAAWVAVFSKSALSVFLAAKKKKGDELIHLFALNKQEQERLLQELQEELTKEYLK